MGQKFLDYTKKILIFIVVIFALHIVKAIVIDQYKTNLSEDFLAKENTQQTKIMVIKQGIKKMGKVRAADALLEVLKGEGMDKLYTSAQLNCYTKKFVNHIQSIDDHASQQQVDAFSVTILQQCVK